jgi:NAD(P)-dependent dehydrogenase (short-subunit alcohol dehydrogenase family)
VTGLLLPSLLAASDARVVTVSSNASRWGGMRWDDLDSSVRYEKWSAYGQSKLANLLFAFEFARRIDASGASLRSVACHPGYANTNLQYVGPSITGSRLSALTMWLGNTLLAQSARAGAWPTLFAATQASARNGDYIGPRGPSELWGRPKHVRARRLAYSTEAMQKLWDVSTQRTGVRFAL